MTDIARQFFDLGSLEQAVKKQLEERVAEIYERHKREMVEEINRAKNDYVSSVVLSLMKHVNFQMYQDNLLITVVQKEVK